MTDQTNTARLFDRLDALGPCAPMHRPWPRHVTDRAGWLEMIDALEQDGGLALIGLWADTDAGDHRVHAALRDESGGTGAVAVISLPCPDGRFPSLSSVRPSAIRLERAAQDLFGLTAEGLTDPRPWFDHGRWGLRHPLAGTPIVTDPNAAPPPYTVLPCEGEGLHQIPVGPVHAGIIEPGHFRFTANGETVVRLEERLGYVHKGIEALMRGQPVERAARVIARLSGDSTVAHSIAFAQAVEAALELSIPPRAVWLRALMAELERLANHLGDIGAIANDAAFAFLLAHLSPMREAVLRAADACFGHRLMMDCVVPGGVTPDIAATGPQRLLELTADLRRRFAPLVAVYDDATSLQDRTLTTGVIHRGLANRFAAGGFVGRASGRGGDARKSPGYAPYTDLEFEVPVLTDGDVNARVWIRIHEVEQSLSLIEQIVRRMPGVPRGPDGITPPPLVSLPSVGEEREGMALVESFRGDILTWVRIAATGVVARCHPRDPSWFQWPLLEAAIEGNIVADFPLCNKSVNGSYSGHDL